MLRFKTACSDYYSRFCSFFFWRPLDLLSIDVAMFWTHLRLHRIPVLDGRPTIGSGRSGSPDDPGSDNVFNIEIWSGLGNLQATMNIKCFTLYMVTSTATIGPVQAKSRMQAIEHSCSSTGSLKG
jgi:hypothetical protein